MVDSFTGYDDRCQRGKGKKTLFFCPSVRNNPEAYDITFTNDPDAPQNHENFKNHTSSTHLCMHHLFLEIYLPEGDNMKQGNSVYDTDEKVLGLLKG